MGADGLSKGRQLHLPSPEESGPLLLLTPFCIFQSSTSPFSEDLINKLGASILLGWGEVQEGREFKQRLHRLVTPDDPPAGHQNIPQDIPQEVREQADPEVWDTSGPERAKCVLPIN